MFHLYNLKFKLWHKLAVFALILAILLDLGLPQLAIAEDSLLNWKQNNLSLPTSPERQPRKIVEAVVTVYTSTPDQTDDSPFIAANGQRVYDGLVAANWLPLGTHVRFPEMYGDKIFTINDRMNKKYGYGRADIWFNTSRAEALKFGVQRLKMEIY
ncbi:MAG: hypothetical protein UT86_C0004G0013 [Candidatus Magasanikbacteria bacterium GW2011_GWC2_40_17]|uniref:3D domain-containing protein n=1 Tax=Candidatus Magasanikbacteria bacterium GW2011_GWA2_42_32 TaxID=1619039 RepID=A0A0G1D4W7_9BACT|nr:MAG: hypothetical protein UT86_C0004G0013 [Candidatus Magasanikbacteria bacterium GW2011_GWC2_40_17]KKS57073.1 MAG: hypothetical protein UV20_C0003G0013 [Candidatus Magasanikbacteria bacterium GW2011_GWA2_42_32]OGH85400.1 MAG: hypothetical protein A2294_01400 [Candidatus Magasanikbacteria bacterium RIFOXYB2_FULL_38_10]